MAISKKKSQGRSSASAKSSINESKGRGSASVKPSIHESKGHRISAAKPSIHESNGRGSASAKPSIHESKGHRITSANPSTNDLLGQIAAINRSQAVIEFAVDGTVLSANDNFLRLLDYTIEEIRGKSHGMFVNPAYRNSADYRAFWEKLDRGEFDAGQYQRIAKDGREIWIQATYNPVFDPHGKPVRIVEFATDITEQKQKATDTDGQLRAVSKSQAVIEFNMDGAVLTANENFLNTFGYTLDEIRGKPHSMFVDPADRDSSEYRSLWEKLGRGEFDAGEYKRIGQGGKEVWLQASYNPIIDLNGKPFKVAQYATDITQQKGAELAMEAEIRSLVEGANAGDLTKRLDLAGKTGLFAEIGNGINQLTNNMAEVVSRVQAAATEVSRGADEISMGNTDLSQRTEEQASSLEQTASSMEEMTSTVKQNADSASKASQLATAARDQADKGGAVVTQAIRAMSEINESSRKIVDIIGVIDEIAFQTNLLALNAAVEAARAGEQGRGFAVVASEVRNLAGRSATAAKEIKGLIQDSVKKVEEGSSLVTQSGQTLEHIVTAVKKVSDIIGEIAGASQEQSAGIDEVNKAVMHLDEMTQQNAALVEQASAASQSMAGQAKSLTEMMEHYSVSKEAAASAAASVNKIDDGLASRKAARSTLPSAAPKVERRAGARPWSAGEKPAPSTTQPRAKKAAAVDGNDSEWKEF